MLINRKSMRTKLPEALRLSSANSHPVLRLRLITRITMAESGKGPGCFSLCPKTIFCATIIIATMVIGKKTLATFKT